MNICRLTYLESYYEFEQSPTSLSWRPGACFVSDEGIFTKFSATTKEFLLTVKEFLQNFHQKYEGIEYS